MPNIQLLNDILGENAAEKKAQMPGEIADAIREASGPTHDKAWIVFENVTPREWHVGGKSVEQNRRESR